jgi:hypothetical protein
MFTYEPFPNNAESKMDSGIKTSLCNWILDILSQVLREGILDPGPPQVLREGNNTSITLTLHTGAPQG